MQSFSERYEAEVLNFDREQAAEHICETMRELLRSKLRKRGLVVAVSGGIDSSVSAALAVRAIGPKKCFFMQLPEVDSAEDTQSRSSQLIQHLGVESTQHNIASTLEAIGCYDARDEAIKKTFPEYTDGWKNKIVIKGGIDGQVNHFMLVVQDPSGNLQEKRLDLREYLQIVAATNYKQRIRKTIEYYHADRLNYAVVGTPNRLEYDQGFFVKNGDGSADVKPIAHLYKTQVYALAKHLGLPDSICDAIPTTDTYSLPQGQDEFYFALPYQEMDKALWAHNHDA
ncbi:MAG: NAD(+) synthase, partial [gamma proteobacterium symbiont of Stewartia floridana]